MPTPTTGTSSRFISPSEEDNITISKNERRRQERREKKLQLKLEKKQKKKESKRLAARAVGRDWDAEQETQQQYVDERTRSGDRKRRLDGLWKEKLRLAATSFRICIDCSFESGI